jgi:hypothetical protein
LRRYPSYQALKVFNTAGHRPPDSQFISSNLPPAGKEILQWRCHGRRRAWSLQLDARGALVGFRPNVSGKGWHPPKPPCAVVTSNFGRLTIDKSPGTPIVFTCGQLPIQDVPDIKRPGKRIEPSADSTGARAERTRLVFELLPKLVQVVVAHEEAQRKFRNAVLIRLSRLDTMMTMIQGAQIAEARLRVPHSEERMRKHAREAQAEIEPKSQELGIAMVKYIYGDPAPEPMSSKGNPKRPG